MADVDPATLLRKSCRFFWICHESLWPLLRATKRHKAACGFCFRHPVGTLNSRGLWSRGQHGPHKIRRGTVDGICWFIFGDLFRRNGVTFATSSEHRQRVLGNPGGAVPRCCLTPNQQESTFVSAPSSDTVRQLDAASNTGCPSPRDVVVRRHESTGSCAADLPGDMREPERTVQRLHSRF